MWRSADDRSLRRLPRIVEGALSLVWHAAPREALGCFVLQVIAGAGVAVQLFAGRHVLERILGADRLGDGLTTVLPSLAVLLGVTAGLQFATTARMEVQRLLAELVGRHAQSKIIQMATVVDLEAYENPDFHDRLQRAQMAANFRPLNMTMSLMSITGAGIGVVGLLVTLLILQPVLVPFVALAYVPVWLATARNSQSYHRFGWGMTPADRKRQYLGTALTAKYFAQEVRSFDLAGYLGERYDRLYDERIGGIRNLSRTRLRRALLANLASSVLSAVSIAVLVALLLSGRIDVASAAAAAVAIHQLGGRLTTISQFGGQFYEDSLFLDDYNSFVEAAPTIAAARACGAPPNGFRTLTVDRLSFAYPGTEALALDDVSLQIHAGEVVALVGENGSGKTTLAKLLCHLYTPTEGRILWDDIDIAACDPVALRRKVAVIFQDFVQYFLTAAENVGVGDHGRAHDLAGIVAAACQSGADPFLAALSSGYDSMLGRQFDGGSELSIGQWQRVALARAFFRGAPLVILDEPTSALDPRGEHELFACIREMAKGRTILLISHRFSSVRSADRIFVLQSGRLVEQGTHDDLMGSGGLYAELFSLQAGAYL